MDMNGAVDALRSVLVRFDPKRSNLISTRCLRDVLCKVLPSLEEDLELLIQDFAVGSFTDYQALLASLQLAAEGDPCHHDAAVPFFSGVQVEHRELRRELRETRDQLEALERVVRRQPLEFTVGQYNILAGYMGNNMEPWFLYGVDMAEERRKEVFKLHGERLPDGKPANPGWPNYVRGVLSAEEIRAVEEVHSRCFDWEVGCKVSIKRTVLVGWHCVQLCCGPCSVQPRCARTDFWSRSARWIVTCSPWWSVTTMRTIFGLRWRAWAMPPRGVRGPVPRVMMDAAWLGGGVYSIWSRRRRWSSSTSFAQCGRRRSKIASPWWRCWSPSSLVRRSAWCPLTCSATRKIPPRTCSVPVRWAKCCARWPTSCILSLPRRVQRRHQ